MEVLQHVELGMKITCEERQKNGFVYKIRQLVLKV